MKSLAVCNCTCGASVAFQDPHLDQRQRCHECGRMLTVVKIGEDTVGIFVADWGDVRADLIT